LPFSRKKAAGKSGKQLLEFAESCLPDNKVPCPWQAGMGQRASAKVKPSFYQIKYCACFLNV